MTSDTRQLIAGKLGWIICRGKEVELPLMSRRVVWTSGGSLYAVYRLDRVKDKQFANDHQVGNNERRETNRAEQCKEREREERFASAEQKNYR